MTLSPTISRFHSVCSTFFYIQFIAYISVNSLQIFVRSYYSSELRWQVFSLWWTRFQRFVVFGPTESFRYNRSIPLGAIDFTTRKIVCHLFYVSSVPAPLNESCPLQASHFYKCFVLWLKDQTHSTDSRKPFLEIDVKGVERDHIKAYHLERDHIREGEYHLLRGRERSFRGRERSPGGENTSRKYFSRIPDAWCSRGEMPHVFLRGKTCSYVLICISSVHLFLWALIFCSLSSPSIPC